MSSSLLRQLAPLELDPVTNEPFLRLPAPHAHIVITPPRMSDAQFMTDYMNDPRVFRWTYTPPWPYHLEHALYWLEMIRTGTDVALKQLEDVAAVDPDGTAPLLITPECPVRSIRERRADGAEVYIGDCGFQPTTFEWELDPEERARLAQENAAHPPGSPNIVWSIGDYLAPSHHGQGIMSAVIKALVGQWVLPRMNARIIRPTIQDGNEGSLRVFYKNGFVLWRTVPNAMQVKAKGEFPAETRTIHVLEYRANQ
ncbi:GNAT domain-containing protein [Vararia minispora EC-137]|uniref:GNAT domain-containing protein n=1 Tax=Vararia minispora EC-137 TaxID=1314806 RepID=A0ACB8QA46_9AGAM|nr:GNAT domain-containing protein [Vararia minispora EC-137]